ncbi:plasmid partitioning protein RepB C-terminal domain-containing protein [Pollutimonas harenae]|uniref:Chromosome partitioning protein ParB n=1 Tax=Pollutimonas harenae TaxID=657015 RepID=A0A853H011_9BURK|nr:plasmid partitioning protein RepB C-terminal domain-containing protein [Pollutimonas harenae]NYT85019.1 chromosome partitioning protein ParB [Pollutimonas harenae]TEA72595.1 chromosome partitioning protein ParB [Pollutimonas harenae]
MSTIDFGFGLQPMTVPVTQILPSRQVSGPFSLSKKYAQIRASINDIGLIEPLSIAPKLKGSDHYFLLDGHIRLSILREMGEVEVPCLVAKDDEGYTYNGRLNRLSSIQEHIMICRAIDRGVSPQRLATALNVNVSTLKIKRSLLDGLCEEVVHLLQDRQFSPKLATLLRKMKPTRQIECVELMLSANNLTGSYVEALLMATPASQLVEGKSKPKVSGVTPEQLAKMEVEMQNIQAQYKLAESSYGDDMLHLTLTQAYLAKLLKNTAVVDYLRTSQPDMLQELEGVVRIEVMDLTSNEVPA